MKAPQYLRPRRCRVIFHLAWCLVAPTTPARADLYPLPEWFFTGGGNGGTWDGSSSSPDQLNLTAQITQSLPMAFVTAVAQSSSAVLIIASNTTYRLHFAGSIAGTGSGSALLVGDSATLASVAVNGITWRSYTNSLTIGGAGDSRVGQNLYVQILLNKSGSPGVASSSLTNIQLHVDVIRPVLAIHPAGVGPVQLRWPTNFDWYLPETTANLSGGWSPVTNLPTIQSNQFVLQLGGQPGAHYYRLRQD